MIFSTSPNEGFTPIATDGDEIIYVNSKKVIDDDDSKIKVETDKEFQYIPHYDDPNQRDVIYVFGASGSGKTTWTRNYAKFYVKLFPNNRVFLFSNVSDVNDYNQDIPKIKKIPLDEETLEGLTAPMFKDSLVIFDDIDSIFDKNVKKLVDRLKNQILQEGRHNKIYTVNTSHLGAGGWFSKIILNESTKIVLFPSGSSQNKYIMEKYLGISKKDIPKILKQKPPSRWIMFNRTSPSWIMRQKDIVLYD